jgi:serine/threonine protein kinase
MSRALGRYELLRPLARGGMAEVYLARRRAAGVEKVLVVKRIRPERSGDVRFLDMFVKEARLSMSLAHQNIVPVFDFGRIDDQVFLAMERVEGKDLSSCLTRAGERRLPPLLAAFIAAECCQALDYAHRRKSPEGVALGIVHRDVTPRNVLLSWSGEVKLTDFGIASLAGDSTSQLIGTPAYLAPEQARGEQVDARADVYAVGLVLREALTGERARPGGDREALIEAAKAGRLLPWPAGVTGPLVTIIDHATTARTDERYPDARTMLADLDAFIVGERSANKGDAPARALAAWLDAVWIGDRDDEGEGDVDAQHLVSFLDDGALDVMGTGTERSMLATAGDESAAAPPPLPPERTPPPANVATKIPDGLETDPIARSRRWVGPAMLVGAAALGGAVVIAMRGSSTETSRADQPVPPAPIATPRTEDPPKSDPPRPEGPAPTTQEVVAADRTSDTGSAGSAVASGPGSAERPKNGQPSPGRPKDGQPKTGRPKTGQPKTGRPKDGQTGQPLEAESTAEPTLAGSGATVMRNVTINATPWAYFTVDDGSTQYETMKTIQLAPGRHTVHFNNPVLEVERDAVITVPEDRDTSYVEKLGD